MAINLYFFIDNFYYLWVWRQILGIKIITVFLKCHSM